MKCICKYLQDFKTLVKRNRLNIEIKLVFKLKIDLELEILESDDDVKFFK